MRIRATDERSEEIARLDLKKRTLAVQTAETRLDKLERENESLRARLVEGEHARLDLERKNLAVLTAQARLARLTAPPRITVQIVRRKASFWLLVLVFIMAGFVSGLALFFTQ